MKEATWNYWKKKKKFALHVAQICLKHVSGIKAEAGALFDRLEIKLHAPRSRLYAHLNQISKSSLSESISILIITPGL